MKISRAMLPLFFAFALLSAQQGGAAHALSHALEQTQQQDKQTPHSPACEQCATYAQLGSALHVGTYHFALPAAASAAVLQRSVAFRSIHILAAVARGPPAPLQKIA
jgi:hypothetical protein